MKSLCPEQEEDNDESHPARGAWIEIIRPSSLYVRSMSRTPQGVRGLKCQMYCC